MTVPFDAADVRFDERGLVPVVIRDAARRRVLTLAYMNAESLRLTVESGEMWLWSRSRAELWRKGGTSGNTQRVVRLALDCDGDAILADVEPAGPACHTGEYSCFGDDGFDLASLERVLAQRRRELPEGSYTAKLFRGGKGKILKKIGEESAEVVIAAASEGRERLVSESADLVFHLLVLLANEGIGWEEVVDELGRRR